MREPSEKLLERLSEIKKLYNLSESDVICMTHMATILIKLGYSPELLVKLLRALTTMWEMAMDEFKVNENK